MVVVVVEAIVGFVVVACVVEVVVDVVDDAPGTNRQMREKPALVLVTFN